MAKRWSAQRAKAARHTLAAVTVVALHLAVGCSSNETPSTSSAPIDAARMEAAPLDAAPMEAAPMIDVSRPADVSDATMADGAPDTASACTVVDAESRFAEWPLPDPTIATGSKAQSYDISVTDVATDKVTGLSWQRQMAPVVMTWADARANCACLSLGGQKGWRLPTRMEMMSIVDFTRRSPSINPTVFPGTPDEWFWTSSEVAGQPGFVWYIYFDTGFSKFIDVETTYRVRCVHSPTGRTVNPQPYRIDGETVTDARTGLTWQRTLDDTLRTQTEAKTFCASSTVAGGGWRLPGMKELQSLVDEGRMDPSIDVVAFPNTPTESFWTDTPVVGIDGSAWRVSFHQGYTYDENATYRYRVRCVR